jgi:hypothetical protein
MRSIPVSDGTNYSFVIFREALGVTNCWKVLVQYGDVRVSAAHRRIPLSSMKLKHGVSHTYRWLYVCATKNTKGFMYVPAIQCIVKVFFGREKLWNLVSVTSLKIDIKPNKYVESAAHKASFVMGPTLHSFKMLPLIEVQYILSFFICQLNCVVFTEGRYMHV